MIRHLIVLLGVCLATCAPMPSVAATAVTPVVAPIVATPATLDAVLGTAAGGATIKLAPGDYGDRYYRGKTARTFSPPVTIDAGGIDAAGAPLVTFRSLRFDNSSGLRIRNITFAGAGNAGFKLIGGSDVQIDGLFADGTVRAAAVFERSTDIRVTRVEAVRMGSDGIDLKGVQRAYLGNIVVHGGAPTPGAHADAIAIYSKPGDPPTTDVTVDGLLAVGPTSGVVRFGDTQPATRLSVNNVHGATTMAMVAVDGPCTDCAIRVSKADSLPGARFITQISPQKTSATWTGVMVGNSGNSSRPPAR